MEELRYEYAKEFPLPNSNECFCISRELLEGLPCPFVACCWTDQRMEELARLMGMSFQMSKDPSECEHESGEEQVWEEYYNVLEEAAISLGMKYLEDLSDDAYNKLTEWCKKHNE